MTDSRTPCQGCLSIRPVPLVVRSRTGSWNMTRTLSEVIWMSGQLVRNAPDEARSRTKHRHTRLNAVRSGFTGFNERGACVLG
jgi:hypothetical protein